MRAGAAEVDISPDDAVDLCGFALREQPGVGVERPIFARALYLEDERRRFLWINCDVIALDAGTVNRIRAWAGEQIGLSRQQVLLSATHTHSAPGTIHLFGAGAFSARYVAELEEKMKLAARAAIHRMERCEIVWGRAALSLSIDRRNKPSAHVDPWVWGLGFRRADGSFIAATVNYAMHPVAHGHVQRKVSPDWCGAAADAVHERLAGNPITLVCNGAAGNLNPPRLDLSWNEVRELGARVSNAIVPALAGARRGTAGIDVVSETVAMPLEWMDEAAIARDVEEGIQKIPVDWQWTHLFKGVLEQWREKMIQVVRAGEGRQFPIELQVARLGDVYLVAVNGEMFSRFTELVRSKVGDEKVFTVAYANAAFGYIPTRQAYAEGGYEVEQAHLFYGSFRPKAGALEMLAERAGGMVGKMASRVT